MVHARMFTLRTAGSVPELARMIGAALYNFEVVASTTNGNIREDVRGIGCMLYAGESTLWLEGLIQLNRHLLQSY